MASAFVRCEDPALLAQAVAAPAVRRLELRLLAPTVAIAQAPIGELLAALREAGLAPAAEDASGVIVDLAARGARVTATPHRRSYRSAVPASNREGLAALVSVLRRVDSTPDDGAAIDPTRATRLLLQAAIDRADVLIGYLDASGMASRRVVTPVSVRGGILNAFDEASGRVREFAVHRITSVLSDPAG
jgi:predicted DNA-binding transcriptional regulator YafY